MPLNQYFTNYTANNEQDLVEGMIIENIQIKGLNIKYIPRTHQNFDELYGEDPTSSFQSYKEIEMYVQSVDGFGGDSSMFSNFGIEISQTATITVSKKRFSEEYPDLVRPKEGDLLFMPITNALLEIKFVEAESPFFQHGKQYVWDLKCELYVYSYEDFETGSEVDDLIADTIPDEFNLDTSTEKYGKNDDIVELVETEITYDPRNPFGV